MDKKWALRWASALESGRYKQTIGLLKRDEKDLEVKRGEYPVSYCCLGVLQEIAGCRIRRGAGALSKTCMKITGVKNESVECVPVLKHKGSQYCYLDNANDGGVGFKRIAKYIRRHYESL